MNYMYNKKAVETASRVIGAYYTPKYGVPIECLADEVLDLMDWYEYDGHEEEFALDFGGEVFLADGDIDENVFKNFVDWLVKERQTGEGLYYFKSFDDVERYLSDQ